MKKTQQQQDSLKNYLFSMFNHYFNTKTDKIMHFKSSSGIVLTNKGILPQKNTQNTFFLTKDTITAPITINYSDQHEFYASDSSLNSSVSSLSTSNESDYHHRNSISSTTLSEILCDHYINRHQDVDNQVPLETYKVFERHNNYPLSDDDESWFIWDVLQKEKQWTQIVDEPPVVFEKSRSTRINPAHLRMLVAEVNMMRSNKIVCPLRLRSSLPPRNDNFIPRLPSPLRN